MHYNYYYLKHQSSSITKSYNKTKYTVGEGDNNW